MAVEHVRTFPLHLSRRTGPLSGVLMSQRPTNRMEAAINTEPMIIAYEFFMRVSMKDLTRSYHQPENLRHSKEKHGMAMPG